MRSGRHPTPPVSCRLTLDRDLHSSFPARDTAQKVARPLTPPPPTPACWLPPPPPPPPAWAPAAGQRRAQDADGSERCLKPSWAKGPRSGPVPPCTSPPQGTISPLLPRGPSSWPLRGALDRRDSSWLEDTAPGTSCRDRLGPDRAARSSASPGPFRTGSRSPSSEEMSPVSTARPLLPGRLCLNRCREQSGRLPARPVAPSTLWTRQDSRPW